MTESATVRKVSVAEVWRESSVRNARTPKTLWPEVVTRYRVAIDGDKAGNMEVDGREVSLATSGRTRDSSSYLIEDRSDVPASCASRESTRHADRSGITSYDIPTNLHPAQGEKGSTTPQIPTESLTRSTIKLTKGVVHSHGVANDE